MENDGSSGWTMNEVQVLDGLRRKLAVVDKANDHVDGKALGLIQSASLLIAVASALILPNWTAEGTGVLVLASALVVFAGMLVCATLAWAPNVTSSPGSLDWDEIYDLYLTPEAPACFDQMLSDTLRAIQLTQTVNTRKARYLHWSMALFVLLIMAVAGFAVIAMA